MGEAKPGNHLPPSPGADRGILVESDEDLQPLALAKMLKAIVEKGGIVVLGKQAIDGDSNQTGQMLAPAGLAAGYLRLQGREGRRHAQGHPRSRRRLLQVVTMPLPTIITADLRLNEPRYASLPNI